MIALALLAALLPLLITPGLLFHYDITPKIVVLCVAVAGCLALPGPASAGIAALWSRKAGRWLCVLAAAQVLWYGIASAFSSRPWFSLLGSNWRRMGLVTVAALCLVAVLTAGWLSKKPAGSVAVLRAVAIATLIASTYGVFQYFDIDPLQTAAAYHAQAGDSTIVRPPGTMGHADYFGWWLAIALFCAVALARVETGYWRRPALSAGVFAGVAIVFSGTRSAILAVAAGFVSLAFCAGVRPGRKHVLAGILFAAALAAFYFSPAGVRLKARVRWSSDEPVGGARPLLWRDSLRMAAARPWAGFGPETFAAEFPRYQSVELARLLPDFYHESPHNTALDALTGEGIPGLAITLAWAALGGYAAVRARGTAAPALASALVASGVASLFGAATVGPVFATLLVIAMLAALNPPDRQEPKIKPSALLALGAPIAVCMAAFGVLLGVADFSLARFQNGSGDAAVLTGLYETSARTALPGAAEDLYCSRRLATLCADQPQCADAALRAARRATESADDPPNAWYNRSIFEAGQNDIAKVELTLRKAALLAPHWFKPHWSLANLLALTGRPAEARREAEQAFLLDAGKDAEVTETLKKLTQ